MAKLKNILNESNVKLGKVYSNPYATSFVKENEEQSESEVALSEEQRKAFFEAVKQYRKYGESVYRNAGLEEVYETIKNMVEVANKVTLSETGDWFDNVTVGRHMKRMGESFKVFEKTLKEVGTLQQRLESSYDEIGEVLSKYYEINEMEDEIEEGNEFGAARAKAIANGDDSFEVDGKTYPVKDVDKDDKENAKDFANESTSMKLTDILNKSNPINEVNTRLNKKVKSFMDAYLKGIPASSPEYHHTVMVVLKGALTDANFHSEAKKLDSMFPKAKKSKYYDNSNMNDVMEDKGVDIAGWAKWDGHDILDAFSYFTNMTIGGGFGNKLETLKESVVNEAKDVGHYERVGNQTIVDSNFVNYSKGVLPNSELVHLGMGDFAIKSPKGMIKFQRSGKLDGIGQDFVGRPHRMTDDKNGKLVELFLKLMLKNKKAILSMSESVNEGVEPQIKKIAHFTGTRPEAVEDFVSKHSLNITKLLKYVQKGGLPQRMELVSALAGRDGNATQKKVIKMFSESLNEGKHDAILDKLADIVKGAKSFMDIGKELKSNKIKYSFGTSPLPMYIIDKPVKIAILNKKYADGAEREVGSTAIGLMESVKMNEAKYDIGMARKGNGLTIYNKAEEENGDYKNVAHIDNKGKVKYLDKKIPSNIKKQIEAEAKKMMEITTEAKGNTMKLKDLLNESFGMGELPSSKLLKMKVSAKDMLESVGEDDVNEARVSAKKLLQSVVKGETDRVEGIKLSKEMAQSFLDWQRMSPFGKKYGNLPFNRLFTAAFSWGLNRHADKKSKEYKELEAKAKQMFKARRDESVVNEDDFMMKKLIAKKYGDTSAQTPEGKLLNKAKSYKDFTKWISKYKKYIGKAYLKDILRDLKDLKDLEDDYERADAAGNSYNEKEELNYARQELYTAIRLSMGYNESVVTEGASTEEKRIVMLAVRKIAKYRNVPIDQSVVDVIRAAEELQRDIQKGKVKK